MDEKERAGEKSVFQVKYYAALVFVGAALGLLDALRSIDYLYDLATWELLLRAFEGSLISCFAGFIVYHIIEYVSGGAVKENGTVKKSFVIIVIVVTFVAGFFCSYSLFRKSVTRKEPIYHHSEEAEDIAGNMEFDSRKEYHSFCDGYDTALEILRDNMQTYDDGYWDGHDEGYSDGYEDGYQDGINTTETD